MLLGRHGEVLLSDFGIALATQSARYETAQEMVGTAAYMAPEQIHGKARPASDQYALGIVIYEWLSGERPFHGSFVEICAQQVLASPPPLRNKVPTIPPDVEQVVMTALSKDFKQRFASMQAFATELEQASQRALPRPIASHQQTPVQARSPSPAITPLVAMQNSREEVKTTPIEKAPSAQESTLRFSEDSKGRELPALPERIPESRYRHISRRAVIMSLAGVG
jgi:serine/threonine protein kinase